MSKLSYMRRYYAFPSLVAMMMLCLLTGCIPAWKITVERNLMDTAILGIAKGEWQVFAVHVGTFIVLMLFHYYNATMPPNERYSGIIRKLSADINRSLPRP